MKQLAPGSVGRSLRAQSGCSAGATHPCWTATHRQTARRGPCRMASRASAATLESCSVSDSCNEGDVQLPDPCAAACSSSSSSASWSYRMAFERLYQLSPVLGSAQESISDQLWSHGLFLVSVDDKPKTTPPTPNKGPGEKSPDYYANVGDAIRTLRDDIPRLFTQDLNYEIYRDDITFRDPRNSFSGMKNYRTIFWSLRFHGRIFFKSLYVEVRRIWQPSDGTICMRWTVHGVPRVPWEAEGTFDGISQYKLDSDGRIYEHAVDNVILRDPPVQGMPLLAGLNLVPRLGAAPQQPCPGAWIRGLEEGAAAAAASAANAAASTIDSSNSWLAAVVHFSWVHLYAASLGTLQLQAAGQLVPATAAAGGPTSAAAGSALGDSA